MKKIDVTCECNEVPTVDQLISHLEKQTGFALEADKDCEGDLVDGICPTCGDDLSLDGDRTAKDYADSPANVTE